MKMFEHTLKVNITEFFFERSQLKTEVNFLLRLGEVLAIVGENGVGKTTLLQSIAQIHKGYTGKVIWEQQPETLETSSLFSHNISNDCRYLSSKQLNEIFTLQLTEKFYLEYMSVLDFLFLTGPEKKLHYKIDHNEAPLIHELFWLLLEVLDFKHYLNQDWLNLSDGQKQKAKIIRSIIHGKKILLLDEPFNFLDEKSKKSLLEVFHVACEKIGCGILFTTHDLTLLQSFKIPTLELKLL